MAGIKKYKRCCVCKERYNILENPITDETPLPRLCPSCNSLYWEKPPMERDLMILQDRYLRDPDNRDKKAFDEIIIIVEGLLHNIIASKLKGSAIYLERERRHDLVMESLVVFIEKYTKNPNFKVGNSFTTYLQQLVLNPLYHPKKKLKDKIETSMSSPIGTDRDGTINLGDLLEVASGMMGSEEYTINTLQKELQLDAVSYVLESVFKQVVKNYDLKTATIVLRGIYLQLNPEITPDEISEYWEVFTNDIHLICEYSMKILYDFVREEVANLDEVMSYEEYIDKFGTEEARESNDIEVDDDDTIIEENYEELEEYI